jgi:hypothetical protein
VSIVPTNFASSLAGMNQAERVESKDKERREAERARQRGRSWVFPDDQDQVVIQVEASEAPRNLKANDQEEAHEDRQSRPQYGPDGSLAGADKPPRKIDIKG